MRVGRRPAAHVTFLPQAQALLRHRQDALAEQRQQALLNSWTEPSDLTVSLATWFVPEAAEDTTVAACVRDVMPTFVVEVRAAKPSPA